MNTYKVNKTSSKVPCVISVFNLKCFAINTQKKHCKICRGEKLEALVHMGRELVAALSIPKSTRDVLRFWDCERRFTATSLLR